MTDHITEDAPSAAGIGKRVRIQIERLNLTVPKAALACNLSQASFETYLYGKNMPGALAISALAKGLRCSTDWLLSGKRQS